MRSFRAAFSLVEMLVAVLLLTLLIGVAIFAFKYQLIAIHKTKKVGINKVLVYNQLQSVLESISYYIVDDYDMLNKPMKNLHPYFQATKDEINFITTNPLFSKNIAIAKLSCKDDTLLYKEEKLYGDIDFLRPQLKEDSPERIFYKGIKNCAFHYEYIYTIPSTVAISFEKNDKKVEYYFHVQSDYNQSKGIIDDAIYPVE